MTEVTLQEQGTIGKAMLEGQKLAMQFMRKYDNFAIGVPNYYDPLALSGKEEEVQMVDEHIAATRQKLTSNLTNLIKLAHDKDEEVNLAEDQEWKVGVAALEETLKTTAIPQQAFERIRDEMLNDVKEVKILTGPAAFIG